ncbi:MAG: hypothetical protein U0003_04840 [Vampirovibrionales bacterium]
MLKARQQNQAISPVAWLPVHLTYQWCNTHPAEKARVLQQSVGELALRLGVACPQSARSASATLANTQTQVAWLLQKALEHLTSTEVRWLLWKTTAREWLTHTVTQLVTEHDPNTDPSTLEAILAGDGTALMELKNRLRSVIVRKARALPMPRWRQWHQAVKALKGAFAEGHCDAALKAGVVLLEWALTGLVMPQASWNKRLEILERWLAAAKPEEGITAEQRCRWENQLNTCRQLKLVQLLCQFSEEPTQWTWADMDAMVQQLWLLMTQRQRYHGPKRAVIQVGPLQKILPQQTLTAATLTQLFEQTIVALSNKNE